MEPTAPHTFDSPAVLRAEIDRVIEHVLAAERTEAPRIAALPAEWHESARNLVHYRALRQLDLRPLQIALTRLGLSSLGRSEGMVLESLAQIDARLAEHLRCLPTSRGAARPRAAPAARHRLPPCSLDSDRAEALLHARTRGLFGPRPPHRHIYILVTAPGPADVTAGWVDQMLDAGMNCLRVNTAHDDDTGWRQMVATARDRAAARGVTLPVFMDLAGPKIRTGEITPGTRVAHYKPDRDDYGRITAPAVIEIARAPDPRLLGIDAALFDRAEIGDRLELTDTTGRRRRLEVVEMTPTDLVAYSMKSVWIGENTPVTLVRDARELAEGRITPPAAPPQRIPVAVGDALVITSAPEPGTPATPHNPARIACTLPAALRRVRPGERVLIDDGLIEATVSDVVVTAAGPELHLTVVRAGPGARIRAGKGLNLPDSDIAVPFLTDDDKAALDAVVALAEGVAVSFIRSASDVAEVRRELAARGGTQLALILKIETQAAVTNLAEILLEAMHHDRVAVMIARGDLAVECGFERLAELQEEILWLCEAAHVPVIWATQVLEHLAQTGLPTRAEITDAAMSVRAECVMLNKGPAIATACATLDGILRKMESHQYKKRTLLRALGIARPPDPAPAA